MKGSVCCMIQMCNENLIIDWNMYGGLVVVVLQLLLWLCLGQPCVALGFGDVCLSMDVVEE
jgi:hypothetical protein